MKKAFFSLALMLASFSITAAATNSQLSSTTAPEVAAVNTARTIDISKFEGLVIEQTITFDSGKKAVVYYKLEDGCIAVYSQTNLSGYSLDDLLSVKESKERKVSAVKGKRYGKYTLAQAKRIAAKWLGQ